MTASLTYAEAAKALNEAAYALQRAIRDTTEYPMVDRRSIMLIVRESDRLVDQGVFSGRYVSTIQKAD